MSNYRFKVGDVVVRTHDPEDFQYGDKPMMIIGFDWDYDLILEGENKDGVGWCADYFELYDQEARVFSELERALDKATELLGKERLAETLSDKLTKGSTNE